MREATRFRCRHQKPLGRGRWLWGVTKGHDRRWRFCSPAALVPPGPTEPPGDGAMFSTAATKLPRVANGPRALKRSAPPAVPRIRKSCGSPADTEPGPRGDACDLSGFG